MAGPGAGVRLVLSRMNALRASLGGTMDRIKVGVIGCGNISAIYFKMMRTQRTSYLTFGAAAT